MDNQGVADHPLALYHGRQSWWRVLGGAGGDGDDCEVEEGGDRVRSHPLDSKGDPGRTEGGDVGGCESEG